jgi:hypothetical protein
MFDQLLFSTIYLPLPSRHGNEQNERNYTLPDPQPGRGEVWIRQAKDDLAAANISLKKATDRTYNWVCVQSHQVNITYIVQNKIKQTNKNINETQREKKKKNKKIMQIQCR